MSDNKGRKNDSSKPDMSLIPAAAALEEAAVWTFGKQKYAAYNWHNGLAYSRVIAAMERHLALLKAGLDFDYETRAHHAASIRCASAMLIQYTLEGRTDLDDRIKLSTETKAKIEEMAKGGLVQDLINQLRESGPTKGE